MKERKKENINVQSNNQLQWCEKRGLREKIKNKKKKKKISVWKMKKKVWPIICKIKIKHQVLLYFHSHSFSLQFTFCGNIHHKIMAFMIPFLNLFRFLSLFFFFHYIDLIILCLHGNSIKKNSCGWIIIIKHTIASIKFNENTRKKWPTRSWKEGAWEKSYSNFIYKHHSLLPRSLPFLWSANELRCGGVHKSRKSKYLFKKITLIKRRKK